MHRLIEDFAWRSRSCTTIQDLFVITEAAAREISFSRVALVHGLWFHRPSPHLIRIDNFGEWADLFIEHKYYLDDPALLACQRASAPFSWNDIPALVPLTPQRQMILGEAARHGLRTGFTLPIGVLGEPHGCCSFVSDRPRLPSRWYCRAAALIGADAFREARRLHGFPQGANSIPLLSPRKLECLRFAAMGKTDSEIAIILGIKETTVRTYMLMLRQEFDVVSRTQLAVEALRLGLIGYDDAIPQG